MSRLIRVSISGCFLTMSFESTMDSEHPALAFPQHECGVFAVFGHPNAAVLTYYGLFALQHRGQESAGIVTSNGPASTFQLHRDMGLVSQVFGADELERLKGTRAENGKQLPKY